MASTFRLHFDDDIARAEALCALTSGTTPVVQNPAQQRDLRLAAVGMAVGAMDAYFCDAYVDCLAKRLQSFKAGTRDLPKSYAERNLPTAALLSPPQQIRPNWALRMAARQVMERENILDVKAVAGLFNPVLPQQQQLWSSVIEALIKRGKRRLTGTDWATYDALPNGSKKGARSAAVGHMKRRVADTIQLRTTGFTTADDRKLQWRSSRRVRRRSGCVRFASWSRQSMTT